MGCLQTRVSFSSRPPHSLLQLACVQKLLSFCHCWELGPFQALSIASRRQTSHFPILPFTPPPTTLARNAVSQWSSRAWHVGRGTRTPPSALSSSSPCSSSPSRLLCPTTCSVLGCNLSIGVDPQDGVCSSHGFQDGVFAQHHGPVSLIIRNDHRRDQLEVVHRPFRNTAPRIAQHSTHLSQQYSGTEPICGLGCGARVWFSFFTTYLQTIWRCLVLTSSYDED